MEFKLKQFESRAWIQPPHCCASEPDYLLMPKKSLGQMYVWECFERLQNIITDIHKSI